jgi:Ty3 transposon capsid-like protein
MTSRYPDLEGMDLDNVSDFDPEEVSGKSVADGARSRDERTRTRQPGTAESVDVRPSVSSGAAHNSAATHAHSERVPKPSAAPSSSAARDTLSKQVKLTKYDGNGDPNDWWFKARELFNSVGAGLWNDNDALVWWGSHLTGRAERWYTYFRRRYPSASFQTFTSAFLAEFTDPTIAMRARDQLDRLAQVKDGRVVLTAAAYTREFRDLILQANVSAESMIETYIRGLRPGLRKQIVLERVRGKLPTFDDVTREVGYRDAADAVVQSHMQEASGGNSHTHKHGKPHKHFRHRAHGAAAGGEHNLNAAGANPKNPEGRDPKQWYYARDSGQYYAIKKDGKDLCFNCKQYGHTKKTCPKNAGN